MLKRLLVKNFTVFAEADFEFGPGLNVVVGTNGTGKSHVLKLGYAVLNVWVSRLMQASTNLETEAPEATTWDKEYNFIPPFYFVKLRSVFRPAPDNLSELVRRGVDPLRGEIKFEFNDDESQAQDVTIELQSQGESSWINLNHTKAQQLLKEIALPVFIPAKEILTLGWMKPASNQLRLPIDESYLDLLTQLGGLPLQNPVPAAAAALQQLNAILGGEVEEDNGRFYLVFPKEKRLEMNMVAEGMRKFGTLQRLLSNGSLTPQTTLFWDEPEANLNPALLKKLAAVLAALARQGFQIILATHSLFLMKELHILGRQPAEAALPIRYFGLNARPGEPTHVTTADDFEDLPDIVALDVALAQGEEFLNTLNEPDANL